jgi:hypothetical protein
MLIERTLLGHIAPGSGGEESQHGSHATVSSHANGLADGVGLSSGLLDGFIVSEDCAFVMNGEPTSTKPFFRLPAHSSVGGTSRGFVRRTKIVYGRFRPIGKLVVLNNLINKSGCVP